LAQLGAISTLKVALSRASLEAIFNHIFSLRKALVYFAAPASGVKRACSGALPANVTDTTALSPGVEA